MTTFEMNGKTYTTDLETLEVLRSIIPSAKSSGDSTAVAAVMSPGLTTGRIQEFPPVAALTAEQTRKILSAIADCGRYIAKEGPRDPELRPARVQQTLDHAIAHRAKLQRALDTGSMDELLARFGTKGLL